MMPDERPISEEEAEEFMRRNEERDRKMMELIEKYGGDRAAIDRAMKEMVPDFYKILRAKAPGFSRGEYVNGSCRKRPGGSRR